jgi:hypothetical protein
MSHNWFRHLMLAFALILAIQSVWIVLPEAISPGAIHLPLDGEAAAAAKLQRPRAWWAALLGFVRGDLWADIAFTYADLIQTQNPDANQQTARAMTERALIYSPHRADVWLLLALLFSHRDGSQAKLAAALKMSYYTGANEIYLVPWRIFASVSSSALDDTELQDMVRRDIRMIITREPELKPTLIAVYNNASASNKKFMENAIGEVDPQFLASVIKKPN